jgi:exopolysaccharide biosynthesis WecB/TagA/CpsF family protein
MLRLGWCWSIEVSRGAVVNTPAAAGSGYQRRRLGHVDVEALTLDGALQSLIGAVAERKSGAWGFCNAHTVNVAADDVAFRTAVRKMTMFNDGIGVDIGSRWLYGSPFPENLNGTDLIPKLLRSLPDGTPIYLLGGTVDVVAEASEALAAEHPNIRIAGHHHGYFDQDEARAVAAKIAAAEPGLVLVGMGHPRQEIWAVNYGFAVPAPVLCVGALIDRAAGRVPRAPSWMLRMRAEWLFRLFLEPRRLAKRYLWGNLVFLYRVQFQRRERRAKELRSHA